MFHKDVTCGRKKSDRRTDRGGTKQRSQRTPEPKTRHARVRARCDKVRMRQAASQAPGSTGQDQGPACRRPRARRSRHTQHRLHLAGRWPCICGRICHCHLPRSSSAHGCILRCGL